MIKINYEQDNGRWDEYLLKPTIFPDKTSQVWKIPPTVVRADWLYITWKFEEERELFDLFNLRAILPNKDIDLFIPYLPYGRQDKYVSNESTFSLTTFARLLKPLKFRTVKAFDPHSKAASFLIDNFISESPKDFQMSIIKEYKPDCLIFPDAGAYTRYKDIAQVLPCYIAHKQRDQLTGELAHTHIEYVKSNTPEPLTGRKALIVDDICDGGATFISVAKLFKNVFPNWEMGLMVSHGIFSKGVDILRMNGICPIYTTNSFYKGTLVNVKEMF